MTVRSSEKRRKPIKLNDQKSRQNNSSRKKNMAAMTLDLLQQMMANGDRTVGSGGLGGGAGRARAPPQIIYRDDVMNLQLFHEWNEAGKVLGFLLSQFLSQFWCERLI